MIASEIYDLINEVDQLTKEIDQYKAQLATTVDVGQKQALETKLAEATSLLEEAAPVYQSAMQTVASAGVNSRKLIESPDTYEADKTYDTEGRIAVNTLGNSDYDSISYLSEKNPDKMFSVLNDEIVVKPKNSPNAKWRPLDPASLELTDIPEAADEIISGVGSQAAGLGSALLSAPTGPAGMALAYGGGSGAGAAGLEALRQALGKQMGVNTGVDMGRVGTEGLLSGLVSSLTYGVPMSQFMKNGKLVQGAREQLGELMTKGLKQSSEKSVLRDISYMSDEQVARELSKKVSSIGSKAGEGVWDLSKKGYQWLSGKDPRVMDYMKNQPVGKNLPKGSNTRKFLGVDISVPFTEESNLINKMINKVTNISGGVTSSKLKEGNKLLAETAGKQVDTAKMVSRIDDEIFRTKELMDANNGYLREYYLPYFNQITAMRKKLMSPDPNWPEGAIPKTNLEVVRGIETVGKDLQRMVESGGPHPTLDAEMAGKLKALYMDLMPMSKKAIGVVEGRWRDVNTKQAKALASSSELGKKFMTSTGAYDTPAGRSFAASSEPTVQQVEAQLKQSLDQLDIPQEQRRKLFTKAVSSIRRAQTASNINAEVPGELNPSQSPFATMLRAAGRGVDTLASRAPVGLKRMQEVVHGTAVDSSKFNQPLKLGAFLNMGRPPTQYDPLDKEGEQQRWNELAQKFGGN